MSELLTTCFECGAPIVFHAGEDIVTCEYCGMKNARPKSSGDELAAMKRGNELRANCEFEEALKCYEYVLRKFPDEHEALWGKLLCKYGVETVEERRFGKVNRYHLCHRVRRTALRNEGDYRRACELAPAEVRAQYEEIAAYVDNVQTKVREKVAGKEGYEVFICYKETVPNSERSTPDSKIARELYLRYQKAGYRVFFAPYTLESKYGEDYEAEIYLALKTSSVMLVIGTKPEYMNATWPKSEWSRYLEFMPDNNGLLIPVFSGMTVKELPQEFRNLGIQGCCIEQHLNYQENIEQTLFERLRKRNRIAQGKTKKTENPKYRRAVLFLESGNFEMADDFFEQVLNEEPENASAYMGKVCVERKVRTEKELEKSETLLADNWNYKLALRFANEEQRRVFEGYNDAIRSRQEKAAAQDRYRKAVIQLRNARSDAEILGAKVQFESIKNRIDCKAEIAECEERLKEEQEKLQRERENACRVLPEKPMRPQMPPKPMRSDFEGRRQLKPVEPVKPESVLTATVISLFIGLGSGVCARLAMPILNFLTLFLSGDFLYVSELARVILSVLIGVVVYILVLIRKGQRRQSYYQQLNAFQSQIEKWNKEQVIEQKKAEEAYEVELRKYQEKCAELEHTYMLEYAAYEEAVRQNAALE